MDISLNQVDNYLQASDALRAQREINELRDMLGVPVGEEEAQYAHLERFLPANREFGSHERKLWLETLAGAMRNETSLPFFIGDPLGVWLQEVLPQLGYRVTMQPHPEDNLALLGLINIARQTHESLLEFARQLEFVRVRERKLRVPSLLWGHERNRLEYSTQLKNKPGILDAQLLLTCLIILYDSSDYRPQLLPDLRAQGRQAYYDPSERIAYVDLGIPAPHSMEMRTSPLINELRHYLTHYLDERVAHRLAVNIPKNTQEDKVHFPYVDGIHRHFLTP